MSREPLQTLVGTAAPFLRPNVDTDVIIRVDRMVSMDPADLAPYAFEAFRFDTAGDEDTECIFNQKPFRGAPILLAGPNFGCGSSREPAVWALQGMGVRCVVAPSFGDIFEANCHQNGLLPITLPEDQMHELAAVADTGALVTVDLADQMIVAAEQRWSFTIGSMQKLALLEGLDDIDLALRARDDVDAWQTRDRAARPWAWTTTRPDRNPAP